MRINVCMALGLIPIFLAGCTQQELNADIQSAAVVSCVLADGSQMEYSVASAVVSAEGTVGKNSQKILNNSALVATGSSTLCTSLSNLNARLQSTAQSSTTSTVTQ